MRNVIEEDWHISYRQNKNNLDFRKICCLWISYNLTEERKFIPVDWCRIAYILSIYHFMIFFIPNYQEKMRGQQFSLPQEGVVEEFHYQVYRITA